MNLEMRQKMNATGDKVYRFYRGAVKNIIICSFKHFKNLVLQNARGMEIKQTLGLGFTITAIEGTVSSVSRLFLPLYLPVKIRVQDLETTRFHCILFSKHCAGLNRSVWFRKEIVS